MPIVDDKLKLVPNAATFEGIVNALYSHSSTGTKFFKDDLTWDVVPKQFKSVVTVSKTGYGDFVCSDAAYESDDQCIQAAIDAAEVNNSEVWIMGGDYVISHAMSIQSNIVIRAKGVVNFYYSVTTGTPMFYAEGTVGAMLSCTSNVAQGASTVAVNSASAIVAGDLILIYDSTLWTPAGNSQYATWKIGELHEVSSVSGNIITFFDQTLHSYTTTNSASVIPIKPISVVIDGIQIEGSSPTENVCGIILKYVSHSKISNCKINNCGFYGIEIRDSLDVDIADCTISNCEYTGIGYGIETSNSTAMVDVHNNTISKCRHCIAASGGSGIGLTRDIKVDKNHIYGGSSWPVDAHPVAESLYVSENEIYVPWDCAVVSGAKHTVVENNNIFGGMGTGIRGVVNGITYEIRNNTFDGTGFIFSDDPGYEEYGHTNDLVVIQGNTVKNATGSLCDITKAANVKIDGNYIDTGVITGADVITVLDNCTSNTGWGSYAINGSTITSITVDSGRLKVIGVPGSNGYLCVTKTFSAAVGANTFLTFKIEGSSSVGYPLISFRNSADLRKTWDNTTDLNASVEHTFELPLHAPVGQIGSRPNTVDVGFVADTITKIIIGFSGLISGVSYTFWFDNISIRTGTCEDVVGIRVNGTTGTISNNTIKDSNGNGIYALYCTNLELSNNNINKSNRFSGTGELHDAGIALRDCTNTNVVGNIITDSDSKQAYSIKEWGTPNVNTIINNSVSGGSVVQVYKLGVDTIVQNNPGFNPVGNFTAPALPASTVAYTNSYGYPCQVQISGGTVTQITLDGVATGMTSFFGIIPPGGTIAITYSSAPTWKWWGL